ncbi:MAG: Stp1/IreP family PP2C-type Ser/Thr phosphatase [Candidatus Rokuibacteriota bacterium]|nr:MAG: Stp1/IreP family PP2C-type Ser/Thr phosphatase [Candidatus Rokubacteria bacterium]
MGEASRMATVTFAHLTDIGRVRTRNEDSLGAFEPDDPALLQSRGRLFVVADGMGGHARGDVASRLAVETLRETYYEAERSEPLPEALRVSVQIANAAVYRESRLAVGEAPMGTTLTALVIRDHDAFLAHVGDSRAFLVRGRQMRQLTEDHSLVAEMVRDGVLSATEAEHHPSAHVILRALGLAEDVTIEVRGPLALRTGDTLVLCTDGLTRQVRSHEIRRLAESRPLRRACEGLVSLANERGGPDNITLQLIRFGPRRFLPAALLSLRIW